MNKITLMGRLVQDIEVQKSKNDNEYAKFTVAVQRKGDKEKTDFFDCVCFGSHVNALSEYTSKGKRIIVDGQINIDSYDTKDGNKSKSVTVIVDNFHFVDFKDKEEK